MADLLWLLDEIDRLRLHTEALAKRVKDNGDEVVRLRDGIKTHRDRWDSDHWDHLPASRDLWALLGDGQ